MDLMESILPIIDEKMTDLKNESKKYVLYTYFQP